MWKILFYFKFRDFCANPYKTSGIACAMNFMLTPLCRKFVFFFHFYSIPRIFGRLGKIFLELSQSQNFAWWVSRCSDPGFSRKGPGSIATAARPSNTSFLMIGMNKINIKFPRSRPSRILIIYSNNKFIILYTSVKGELNRRKAHQIF